MRGAGGVGTRVCVDEGNRSQVRSCATHTLKPLTASSPPHSPTAPPLTQNRPFACSGSRPVAAA